MSSRSALFMLFGLVCVCLAQRPVIKIGWTVPRCGSTVQLFGDQENALLFWQNFINSGDGINVGGVAHNVQLISYNDASDPSLIRMPLYGNEY